jgi:diguanylate cyclase (GGDEF)-like protein/PAS domain S-box-containing protein
LIDGFIAQKRWVLIAGALALKGRAGIVDSRPEEAGVRYSTMMKTGALCGLVFASPFFFHGSQRLVPYIVVQAVAAVFCAYHLLKFRPKRKSVVGAILASEICYTLSYLLVYLQMHGILPDAVHDPAYDLFNGGVAGMAVTAFAMLAIRRPFHYQEGTLDFVAAVAVFATLEWELHGQNGHGAAVVLSTFVVPLVCVLIFVAAAGLALNLFRDSRTNSAIVAVQMLAVSMAGIANAGFAFYGEANTLGGLASHTWPPALAITGGFLLCLTMVHPDTPALFQPERDFGKRLSIWRWLGPAAALATTPAMMTLLLWRRVVPSAPLTISTTVLTCLVIWRIWRLLVEREAARALSELGERRLQSLVEYAADVIAVTNESGQLTYVSPGIRELTGSTPEELLGRPLGTFLDEDDLKTVQHRMATETTFSLDVALNVPNSPRQWVTMTASDHRTDASVRGWVWNLHDITDRKVSEEALSHLALYDQLTGLPNRTQMRDRLQDMLLDTAGYKTAVLFCDLDGFKQVNDVMGHAAGDEVLRQVAGRWSAYLRADDVLGRWGGDEFLVLCAVFDDQSATALADRLITSLNEPLLINGVAAKVGSSIGVVTGESGEGIEALLRRADEAMYVAKRGDASLHIA